MGRLCEHIFVFLIQFILSIQAFLSMTTRIVQAVLGRISPKCWRMDSEAVQRTGTRRPERQIERDE